MQILNLFACLFVFGFCVWAVLWPHFKDGVVMKFGLIMIGINGLAGILAFMSGQGASPQTVFMNIAFSFWAASVLTRRVRRPVWSTR